MLSLEWLVALPPGWSGDCNRGCGTGWSGYDDQKGQGKGWSGYDDYTEKGKGWGWTDYSGNGKGWSAYGGQDSHRNWEAQASGNGGYNQGWYNSDEGKGFPE
eukprot:4397122-Amphidinium_carterae.1